MKAMRKKAAPTAKQLGILAMKYRGTRDEAERVAIAKDYAQTVNELIAAGKFKTMPPLEDQLPDEHMPDAFFEHWKLRKPATLTRRTGTDG